MMDQIPHSPPDSMASSTLTERHDPSQGPRTLTQEVEHIKHLLSRAQAAPPSPAGGITAQIFRQRTSTKQPTVTQAQLFHELDLLKRRIRHETQPRREREESASRNPDSESEAEPEDVTDEREEEI